MGLEKVTSLVCLSETEVRFSEVDSIKVVWHGNYIKYMEDGREAFGKKYGLEYLDVYSHGYVTPIVQAHCEYKKPLRYGERALIETTFVDTPAAKIIFRYRIMNAGTKEVAAVGETVQVFLSAENEELYLSLPPFFEAWKRKVGLAPQPPKGE